MKSLALNMLGNRTDAEDAVQEAFLRAYRGRDAFRSDAALWTWVYRILLNACHDIGRRRGARRGEEALDDAAPELEATGSNHPLRLTIERAVAALAPIYRDVFLLCEVEGHSHREVAEILQIAEGTSKARLFEAKRRLRTAVRAETPTVEVKP